MLSELRITKDCESRSICAENFTGEKGKGGMATDGPYAYNSRNLGHGWKVSPFLQLKYGEVATLADIDGQGIIKHIWITESTPKSRKLILRMYWDGSDTPSVEVPLCDFFACAEPTEHKQITSLAVCVNARRAFNCYWEMPFFKHCKITVESFEEEPTLFAYQIDYVLTKIPENSAYFHAQFRRSNPLELMQVHTILDNVQGNGQYVGTYIFWESKATCWFGEGEIKFYLDGDREYPTICGTGTEDYFGGGWCFGETYCTPYAGLVSERQKPDSHEKRYSMYRWHITDPIYFKDDIRITIQALGLAASDTYIALTDDISSVAFWYQDTVCKTFPAFPSQEQLQIEKW